MISLSNRSWIIFYMYCKNKLILSWIFKSHFYFFDIVNYMNLKIKLKWKFGISDFMFSRFNGKRLNRRIKYSRKLRNIQYVYRHVFRLILYLNIFFWIWRKIEWYVDALIHLYVYSNITNIKFEKQYIFMRFFEKSNNMNSKI